MKKVKFALAALALSVVFVSLPQTSSAADYKTIGPGPLSVVKQPVVTPVVVTPLGFTIVIED